MSRVGKQPITIPSDVEVNIASSTVTVKGKKGELKKAFPPLVNINKEEGKVIISPKNDSKDSKAAWGLTRTIINNMVHGVKDGFNKTLEINGVGYRAAISDNILTLQLGYSHDIKLAVPLDIEVKCTKPTEVIISGIDKQKVGQFASEVRQFRKPEPYKGKGVKYKEEVIRRKEGKKK
jgi:large subunit ribosomal protein L6